MIKEEIKNLIEKSVFELQKEGVFPIFRIPDVVLEHPENKIYGDYSANILIALGKILEKNPKDLADLLINKIKSKNKTLFEKIEIAGPGFINFYIKNNYWQNLVLEVLKKKEKFGNLKIGKGIKVNVEFISANPTGPLTLGNGRGGFCGDVLANILKKVGYKTEKEYYVNNVGEQINALGHSVLGDAEAVYKGSYIEDFKKRVVGNDAEDVGKRTAQIILEEMIKPSVGKMGIKFDTWFLEENLYKKNEVDKVLDELSSKRLAYVSEGALWFKSTQFGDDKDRVLIKLNGDKTYFASDIAYLKNKFKRGFKVLFIFLGADHFGYVNRIKGVAEALGHKKENVKPMIMQLVHLMENGQEVRMSKRTGIYVAINELIEEVGLDVTRFFFLSRGADSHLNFDLNLAKEQSEKNPVFYIQYAYARICSILEKTKTKPGNIQSLNHPSELELIKWLNKFSEIIQETSKDYQIQRIPQYTTDLATAFHTFYRDCKVLVDDKNIEKARLALVLATKIVLKNTLDLMGISAPEKM